MEMVNSKSIDEWYVLPGVGGLAQNAIKGWNEEQVRIFLFYKFKERVAGLAI